MLRPDSKYNKLEAEIWIACVHASMAGNNSTFTAHVVTSSATDTYSSVCILGSLKGFRHGGANIKVVQMLNEIKKMLRTGRSRISAYLKILNKTFDRSGLIYGIGHAVYSLSDPRAVIFKSYVERLAQEKNYLMSLNYTKR